MKPVIQAEYKPGRECGSCTACCVLQAIHTTNAFGQTSLPLLPEGKPGYTPCKHLCSSGCDSYAERPQVCSEFECLWKSGHLIGDERRRPDNIGLMITLDYAAGTEKKQMVEIWELWPGAASDYPGKSLVEAIVGSVPLVAVRYYGVPCALQYHGPRGLAQGVQLTRAALTAPQELAKWLRKKLQVQQLEIPQGMGIEENLAKLESGQPVQLTFKPK